MYLESKRKGTKNDTETGMLLSPVCLFVCYTKLVKRIYICCLRILTSDALEHKWQASLKLKKKQQKTSRVIYCDIHSK